MNSCRKCSAPIGKRNVCGLCTKCRLQTWAEEHRERSNEIKSNYVVKNPKKRKESVYKDNNGKGVERKAKWYDNAWFEGKRRILVRTHPFCSRCGSDKLLQVHHRDGNGLYSPIVNNNWSNLIVLCFPCHMKVHRKKERPYYVGR